MIEEHTVETRGSSLDGAVLLCRARQQDCTNGNQPSCESQYNRLRSHGGVCGCTSKEHKEVDINSRSRGKRDSCRMNQAEVRQWNTCALLGVLHNTQCRQRGKQLSTVNTLDEYCFEQAVEVADIGCESRGCRHVWLRNICEEGMGGYSIAEDRPDVIKFELRSLLKMGYRGKTRVDEQLQGGLEGRVEGKVRLVCARLCIGLRWIDMDEYLG